MTRQISAGYIRYKWVEVTSAMTHDGKHKELRAYIDFVDTKIEYEVSVGGKRRFLGASLAVAIETYNAAD